MSNRWDSLSVDGSDMPCYVALPERSEPTPGVLICMHAPGVDGFIQGIADRLAAAGFAAIAPDLYHRQPTSDDNPLQKMGKLRDMEILRDLDTATTHLRSQPEALARSFGVVGFCMGGRLSYLFAAHDSEVSASVVFYGGNIMVPWGEGPAPFEHSDRIGCPMLGLFGGDDQNPSPDDVAKLDAELTRCGVLHEFKSYPGAGHAFLNEARPSYREEAAADAWQRCEDWLQKFLG
jgi:carboxymethylenebutenolidase